MSPHSSSSPSLSSLSSLPSSPRSSTCLYNTDNSTMPQLGDTSDKLLQEMSSLPRSATAMALAATTSRTPVASPVVASHADPGRSGATSGASAFGSTANPVFLSRIITGAVSEVLSSTSSSG